MKNKSGGSNTYLNSRYIVYFVKYGIRCFGANRKDINMREDLPIILIIILWIIMAVGVLILGYKKIDVDNNEQIKILEQSLQEQIQEKEVYMRMLEEK